MNMTNSPPKIDYSATLEVMLDLSCEVGEGPLWDDRSDTLVFVESFGGTVYRWHPASGALRQWSTGQVVGTAVPRAQGGMVLATQAGLLALDERDGRVEALLPIEPELRKNRMNDAKCDSRGRLWSGTFSMAYEPRMGSLYRIDPNLHLERAFGDVHIANGIAWSPDESRMYWVDTGRRGIDVLDYDIATGQVTNRRRWVTIDSADGMPDGIAMDGEGCLWVALYCGGMLRRYNPDGEWIGTVRLPVKGVTSCGFGGPGLQDLYITTGKYLPDFAQPSPGEHAGALFRCRPGVAGMPVYRFGG